MKPTGQTLIRKTIASGLIAMACFVLTPRTMAQSLSTEGIVKLSAGFVLLLGQLGQKQQQMVRLVASFPSLLGLRRWKSAYLPFGLATILLCPSFTVTL